MGILDFFRAARPAPAPTVRGEADYAVVSTAEAMDEFIRHGGSATASGAMVNPESALRVAAVYRCVDIIAGAIASLPLHMMTESADGRTKAKAAGHPLFRLLAAKPNRWQTSAEFRRMLQAHLLLRGNGYAYIVRSGRRVLELLPMHPDRVKVRQDAGTMGLVYDYTRPDGRMVTLAQADVMHLRDLSTDGLVGLSRIAMMREAVGLALQTERFGARMFKNGMAIGGALKHPGKLGKDAVDRLRTQMEERYAGADNAHKWMILEEGMAVEKLGLTSEDMQFLETRKFQRSDIFMFYGVPPHLGGDTEKTTSWGTGIEQQNIGFLQYTMQPWITVWEQAIGRDLITEAEYGTIYAKFNVNGLLRASAKDRADYYSKALGSGGSPAWMAPNEIRSLEDLNWIEGGDDLPKPSASPTNPTAPKPPEGDQQP